MNTRYFKSFSGNTCVESVYETFGVSLDGQGNVDLMIRISLNSLTAVRSTYMEYFCLSINCTDNFIDFVFIFRSFEDLAPARLASDLD